VDPVVFLRTGHTHILVVPELEHGRAEKEAEAGRRGRRSVEVLTPRMLRLRGKKRGDLAEWACKAVARAGIRRVRVSPMIPHKVARRLERHGIQLRVADGGLFPDRAVKDAAECRRIEEAQQAAVIAMRQAISLIARAEKAANGRLCCNGHGLTSERVQTAIVENLFKHGCLGKDIIVAGGRQSADPHEQGHGVLRAGEPIVIDIFPRHMKHGYWGDLTRTVVRGKAPARLKKMYRAVKEAQAAALAQIRPGVKAATVHATADRVLTEHGYKTEVVEGRQEGFIHSLGHGVGLEIHEGPSLSSSSTTRLRSGHVVTVEPGLYYPDVGGIRIEDTVVVVKGGWRYFTPCEKRLEI
jgi:Xaa-Pro aminopeptidase